MSKTVNTVSESTRVAERQSQRATVTGPAPVIVTQTHIPTAAVPAPRHPDWCDPNLCFPMRGGDVMHKAQDRWTTAEGERIALAVHQLDEPDKPAGEPADEAYIYLEAPDNRHGYGYQLTPAEARTLSKQLAAFATMAGA